jgi:hypothetical protein
VRVVIASVVRVVVIASLASIVVRAPIARAGGATSGDMLADAQRLEAGLEYEKALVVADRAIAAGGADRARLVELELLAGRVAAGLDKPDIAREHFARALAIDPTVALPAGTSPKLTEPFDAARAANVPLAVTVVATGRVVRATITADRLALVAAMRVHVVDRTGPRDDITRVTTGTSEARIADDASAPSADILDEHGNVLATAQLGVAAAPVPVVVHATPIYARWPTWAVTGAVALGAAGICAWQFGAAQDDWNRLAAAGGDYSELTAIESRGHAWGIAADVGFGAAAAAGIVAVVLYIRGDAPPTSVALAPNGAAFVVHF